MTAAGRDEIMVYGQGCGERVERRWAGARDLDKGVMWPTSFALKELTPSGEAAITALVKKAVT